MEEKIIDTKTVKIAAQVIIFAGNARVILNDVVLAIEDKNFAKAEELIKKAEAEMTKAHEIQTDIIQAEARGQSLQLSLLLTHAQDTLMSANTEIRMICHMLRLFKKMYEEMRK